MTNSGPKEEKKPKQRKAQTEEQFLQQKEQFHREGPRINTEEWLYNENILNQLDNTKKIDRTHMLHSCEKAYFMRDYDRCLELVEVAEKLFGVELQDESANDDIKKDFSDSAKKTRKSHKLERHVVDLLHIKEACLSKKLANVSLQNQ